MTPAGIEPATFRFVAQHLNHCATAVPIPTTILKACMVSEGIAPIVLNFSSGLGGWSASRHVHFTPPPPGGGGNSLRIFWKREDFNSLPGFEPSIARTVA